MQPSSSTTAPRNSEEGHYLSSRWPAPIVKVSSRSLADAGEAEITLDVTDRGGGIGDVELSQNGELVPAEPNFTGRQEGSRRDVFRLRLLKTNTFVATATTPEGLPSAPVRFTLPESAKPAKPFLASQSPVSGGINLLSVSPDGQYIATGVDSGEIRVWDRASQLQVETLPTHVKSLNSLAFSPDSNLIVSTARDGAVRIWDVKRGELVRTLAIGSDSQWPDAAIFSPDMRSLTVLGPGNLVHVFSWPDSIEERTFDGNSSSSGNSMLAVSPDSRVLAHAAPTTSSVTKVRITDIETGGFQDLDASAKWLIGGFSADGQLFTGSDGDKAYVWELVHHTRLAEFSAAEKDRFVWIGFMKLQERDSVVAVENRAGLLSWDRASRQVSISTLRTKGPIETAVQTSDHVLLGLRGMFFEPSNEGIFSGISIIDLIANQEVLRARASSAYFSVTGLSFSDADDVLEAASGGPDGQYLHFWDLTTGSLMRSAGPLSLPGYISLANGMRTITAWSPFSAEEATAQVDVKYSRGPDGMLHIDSANAGVGGVKTYAVPGISNPIGIVHTLSGDGRFLAASCSTICADFLSVHLWKTAELRSPTPSSALTEGATSLSFSADGRFLATTGSGSQWLRGAVRVWRTDNLAKTADFEDMDPATTCLAFSADGNRLACNAVGRLYILNISHKSVFAVDVGSVPITSAALANHRPWIAAGLQDGSVRLFNSDSGKEIAALVPDFKGGFIALIPEGFYRTGGTVSRNFALRFGGHAFPVDTFDLRYNRPDQVLTALGGDKRTAELYAAAYRKRLTRSGFSPEKLPEFDHLPELQIGNAHELPARTSADSITIDVRATDPGQLITRISVRVNGVPIFGSSGFSLPKPGEEISCELPVLLSAGSNLIEVSAINRSGTESLRYVLQITKETTVKPALYLVSVGISRYADQQYHLDFATKDAQDLLNLLLQGKEKAFSSVYTLPLLDEDANRENILGARNFISKARVDDIVVVFFAGHGLLDRDASFYFATVDTDFSAPSHRAITFQQLDELLDGISARHRLLLIDACHSGEVDPDAVKVARDADLLEKKRGYGRIARNSDSFQLLSSLFTDLRENSGASVIAASQGGQLSYENTSLKNGYFTHAVLEGLREHKADTNGRGDITVSKLLSYVTDRVTELSHGAQSPAARQTNLNDDFVIWK